MKPALIDQISDQVMVVKWQDGKESILFADKMRKHCPCASCKDAKEEKKSSPFKILKSNPCTVIFESWEYVGNYALRFSFSDNHSTGIYTYEYLSELGDSG